MRSLEGYEGEVEGVFEVVGVGVGVETHAPFLAEVVEEEAGSRSLSTCSSLASRTLTRRTPPLHLRGRHAADGAGSDYQDAGLDHDSSPDPASTGGRSFRSSFKRGVAPVALQEQPLPLFLGVLEESGPALGARASSLDKVS